MSDEYGLSDSGGRSFRVTAVATTYPAIVNALSAAERVTADELVAADNPQLQDVGTLYIALDELAAHGHIQPETVSGAEQKEVQDQIYDATGFGPEDQDDVARYLGRYEDVGRF